MAQLELPENRGVLQQTLLEISSGDVPLRNISALALFLFIFSARCMDQPVLSQGKYRNFAVTGKANKGKSTHAAK